jgi:hypothetical protein
MEPLLPSGVRSLIGRRLRLSRVIHDTYDPGKNYTFEPDRGQALEPNQGRSKHGVYTAIGQRGRCVYGYWIRD